MAIDDEVGVGRARTGRLRSQSAAPLQPTETAAPGTRALRRFRRRPRAGCRSWIHFRPRRVVSDLGTRHPRWQGCRSGARRSRATPGNARRSAGRPAACRSSALPVASIAPARRRRRERAASSHGPQAKTKASAATDSPDAGGDAVLHPRLSRLARRPASVEYCHLPPRTARRPAGRPGARTGSLRPAEHEARDPSNLERRKSPHGLGGRELSSVRPFASSAARLPREPVSARTSTAPVRAQQPAAKRVHRARPTAAGVGRHPCIGKVAARWPGSRVSPPERTADVPAPRPRSAAPPPLP